jgi:hypothetical protein
VRDEPDATVFRVAVENLEAAGNRRVVERGARMLRKKREELLPPRIVIIGKKQMSDRLKLVVFYFVV